MSITPADNQLLLSWSEYVPWSNYKYYVYKKNPAGTFILRDSTTVPSYVESGLANGISLCYKIESVGEYTDTTIIAPLFNFSEEFCAAPEDKVTPCAPSFSITPNCATGADSLIWTNPNHSCADDVIFYKIYFNSLQNGELELLSTVNDLNDTVYIYSNPESIAGCFEVAAVDSALNESVMENVLCVDNCPEYELPNVFSPNNDGINEFFVPLPYRYVKDVDMKIYDRWGLLVFSTTDPDINWGGINQETQKPCVDGVYFYVCKVNEIRVTGIQPRTLTGHIQIFQK